MTNPSYVCRTVSFRYCGRETKYNLSLGLFSSGGADAGTAYLLKSVAPLVKSEKPPASAWDVGCGTGIIAIALKKRLPKLKVLATDRDALALHFTQENRHINGIGSSGFSVRPHLLGEPPTEGEAPFDLILCNIPAKAGNRAIARFLETAGNYLTAQGRVAVVVVSPLKESVRESLQQPGIEILYEESNKQYAIFHFRGCFARSFSFSESYIRQSGAFFFREQQWRLSTVYGIGDFDTLSYPFQLMATLMEKERLSGAITVVEPGQGHLPLYIALKGEAERLHLVSRDSLSLKTTERNLAEQAKNLAVTSSLNAFPEREKQKGSALFWFCDPVSKSDWRKEGAKQIAAYLKKGGKAFAIGKSNTLFYLAREVENLGFRSSYRIKDKKWRGFRGIKFQGSS